MNEIAALLTFVYFTETPEKKGTNKSHIGHLYDSFMCESDAEADIFALFDKILKNGHAEMFTNQKTAPSILSVYKSSNLSDVFPLFRNISVSFYSDVRKFLTIWVTSTKTSMLNLRYLT